MNLALVLAQAAQGVASAVSSDNPVLTPVTVAEPEMNLWDMALKGGWIMIILAALSVLCVYVFFERWAVIRKAEKEDPLFIERMRDYIQSGELKSAINYCRMTNTPAARMIEKGTYDAKTFIDELKDMSKGIVISVLSDNSLRAEKIGNKQ